MKVYAVGGAVRDRLLGRPVSDRDWVVVGATAGEMEALGYRRVGRDFPVFLHPDTHEEYALARRERKVAPGYAGFTFDAGPEVTLEEDLLRRDLTVNAMAETADGTVIDPYGGQADLAAQRLRHVSPAFAEDPVRILRTARFAARLDWSVAEETLALMRDMVEAGEVDALVPERVWVEWERALGEPHPQRFLEVLMDCGGLERIWPELAALLARPDGTGARALRCLRAAVDQGSDACVRSAALLHEVGARVAAGPRAPADAGLRTNAGAGADAAGRGLGDTPTHHGPSGTDGSALEGLLARMRAPNEFHDLALLAARWLPPLAATGTLDAAVVWQALQATDALRRPMRFRRLGEVLAARLSAGGASTARPSTRDPEGARPGAQPTAEAARRRMEQALGAACAVDARAMAARGLAGTALGEALAEARRGAVESALGQAATAAGD